MVTNMPVVDPYKAKTKLTNVREDAAARTDALARDWFLALELAAPQPESTPASPLRGYSCHRSPPGSKIFGPTGPPLHHRHTRMRPAPKVRLNPLSAVT